MLLVLVRSLRDIRKYITIICLKKSATIDSYMYEQIYASFRSLLFDATDKV